MNSNKEEKMQRPKAFAHILFEPSKDGCLLLDQKKECIHSLNRTAAFIWTFCDGKHSVLEIEEALEGFWKAFGKNAMVEVQTTLKKFRSLNLLE